MSQQAATLVSSSDEISRCAEAARAGDIKKVVLVPVDFSVHSERALAYASELAEALPAALIALHVIHDPGEMPGYYSKLIKKRRVARIEDIAAEAFDKFIDSLTDSMPQLGSLNNAMRLMVIGLPVTRILEVVEIVDPFTVIVGSKGRTGLQHALLGSKASQLVQLCPVPVTVVKNRAPTVAEHDTGS